ncbi:MAG: hypothetical protein AAF587_16965 [Bacteroidota bacterium]
MQEITLQITIEEANLILDALGSKPFKDVFSLIGKIQQQAGEQLGDQQNMSGQDRPELEKNHV